MGGLRKAMPWTTASFTVGALALAGVFPLSGFFSQGRDPRRSLLRRATTTSAFGARRCCSPRCAHGVLHDAAVVPRLRRQRVLATRTRATATMLVADGRARGDHGRSSAGRSRAFAAFLGERGRVARPAHGRGCRSRCALVGRRRAAGSSTAASVRRHRDAASARCAYALRRAAEQVLLRLDLRRPRSCGRSSRVADVARRLRRAPSSTAPSTGRRAAWSRLSDVLLARSTSRVIDGAVNGVGRRRAAVGRAHAQAAGRPRAGRTSGSHPRGCSCSCSW